MSEIRDRIVMRDGCWSWVGFHRKRDGRPIFRLQYAYRLVYEEVVGPIPAGLVLDHTCRNKSCVSPFHLEPVRQIVNATRSGFSPGDWGQADKTHCVNGHPYEGQNLYVCPGKPDRHCRECRRASKRKQNAKLKAARAAARAAKFNEVNP